MILYRCMTSNEIINYMNNKAQKNDITIIGDNTHNYEPRVNYYHFFKYAEHAKYLKEYVKDCDIANQYVLIAQCIVPDKIASLLGFGKYEKVKTDKNNTLYNEEILLPEYIIRKEDFKSDYIISVSDTIKDNWKENKIDYKDKILFINKDYLPKFIIRNPLNNKKIIYSQADMYYEYFIDLNEKFNYNEKEIKDYLKRVDLNKEIPKYFKNNKRKILIRYLEKTKENIKEEVNKKII